jgi:hypothetical protein
MSGVPHNMYEAPLVKGNIFPLGGREAAGWCDVRERRCELLTSFPCGCRVVPCTKHV